MQPKPGLLSTICDIVSLSHLRFHVEHVILWRVHGRIPDQLTSVKWAPVLGSGAVTRAASGIVHSACPLQMRPHTRIVCAKSLRLRSGQFSRREGGSYFSIVPRNSYSVSATRYGYQPRPGLISGHWWQPELRMPAVVTHRRHARSRWNTCSRFSSLSNYESA